MPSSAHAISTPAPDISALGVAPAGAKERLIESAVTLFSEKGYNATSIREIIENAGVTRPVLYYYFKNKEDLFCHLVESEFETVCREFDVILASNSAWETKVTAIAANTFERARRSPGMVRILMQFFFSPSVAELHLDKVELGTERFNRIIELMRQGIECGRLREDAPDPLALAFIGLVDMHVMATFDDPAALPAEEIAVNLVDLFLHGAARGD